jgi:hypothetical protein
VTVPTLPITVARIALKKRLVSALSIGLALQLAAGPAMAAPGDNVTNGTGTGITVASGFLFEPEVPFTSLKNVPAGIAACSRRLHRLEHFRCQRRTISGDQGSGAKIASSERVSPGKRSDDVVSLPLAACAST